MNQRSKLFVLLITVALTLVGCNRNTIYSHYEHTPINGWERVDRLSFDLASVTVGGNYHEEIGLRINKDYPFKGLTLIVEQQVFPSGVSRSDTLTCKLIDDKGIILGEGVSFYQYHFHLCDMPLAKGDSLHVQIRHHMRREILSGISDVGVTLTKTH